MSNSDFVAPKVIFGNSNRDHPLVVPQMISLYCFMWTVTQDLQMTTMIIFKQTLQNVMTLSN